MKILIADDQMSVHKFLDTVIDWEQLGFSDVLHAYNGKDCINQTLRFRPDIVLLDIKMPTLDGIQVLEYYCHYRINSKTIMLTAFNEFNFAQAALKLGAKNYILKPIDITELKQAMLKIFNEIKEEKRHLLYEIISDRAKQDAKVDDAELVAFQINSFFCVLIKASQEMIREIPPSFQEFLSINIDDNNLFVFFPCDQQSYDEKISRFRNDIEMFFQKHKYFDYLYSFSDLFGSFSSKSIKTAFHHCNEAMAEHFYFVSNHYFIYREFNDEINQSKIQFYKDNIMISILNFAHSEKIISEICKLFAYLQACHIKPDKLISFVTQLYIDITINIFTRFDHRENCGIQLDIFDASQIADIENLKNIFIESIFHYIENHSSHAIKNEKDFIDGINCYLQNHIDKPLSIDKIAQNFLISKYELCRRYKQMTGETIWDHLTSVKMEKAKDLLKHSTLKITDIAHIAGYSDSSYFSKAFKKYWGFSPGYFKSQIEIG